MTDRITFIIFLSLSVVYVVLKQHGCLQSISFTFNRPKLRLISFTAPRFYFPLRL